MSVYKPLRKNGYSKLIAVLGTFVVSGLLHEYTIAITTLKGGDYKPKFFFQTSFFVWNGIMLVLEDMLLSIQQVQAFGRFLPRPIKTLLVILTSLPVSHWFLNEFVANDIFQDFTVGYPLLVKL